jgi:hypothetical protein
MSIDIDNDVRCLATVGHPLVHGSQQIRPLGRKGRVAHVRFGEFVDYLRDAHFLFQLRQAIAKRRPGEHMVGVFDDRR